MRILVHSKAELPQAIGGRDLDLIVGAEGDYKIARTDCLVKFATPKLMLIVRLRAAFGESNPSTEMQTAHCVISQARAE